MQQIYFSKGLILDVANQLGGPMPSVTTLYDHSRFKNNSSVWSGATWVQLPSKLWTLNFDGNDQITIPNTLAYCLNGYEKVTVLFWAKRSSLVNAQQIVYIINAAASTRLFIQSAVTTGSVRAGGKSDNEVLQQLTSALIPSINDWSLWGCQLNLSADTVTCYSNTSSETSGILAFTYSYFQNTINTTTIGAYAGSGYFTGQLAKLRIWTRALSMAEIRSIYDNEKHLFGIGK